MPKRSDPKRTTTNLRQSVHAERCASPDIWLEVQKESYTNKYFFGSLELDFFRV